MVTIGPRFWQMSNASARGKTTRSFGADWLGWGVCVTFGWLYGKRQFNVKWIDRIAQMGLR